MPKPGPKSNLVLDLDPDQRAQLDRAIVEGRQTKAVLHQRITVAPRPETEPRP